MALFETHNLTKIYRPAQQLEVSALVDVTLVVERGSFAVVRGPSGSGKTTLLALLGALDRPTLGRVQFDGISLETCSDVALARVRRRMGFVFQDYALVSSLTVEENVTYPLLPRGIARGERRRRAHELLTRFRMNERANARACELSGGELQRVSLARALAGEPEVLLADEPTSNLDAKTGEATLEILGELHRAGK